MIDPILQHDDLSAFGGNLELQEPLLRDLRTPIPDWQGRALPIEAHEGLGPIEDGDGIEGYSFPMTVAVFAEACQEKAEFNKKLKTLFFIKHNLPGGESTYLLRASQLKYGIMDICIGLVV